MTKRNKIIYWIATLWLSLGMVSSGIVQILRVEEEVAAMAALGYPAYFLTILGIWKLLGVVVILLPKYPIIKEWAYAGFFFTMSGAVVSHLSVGEPIVKALPAMLLLILTVLSRYFRPMDRKILVGNK